MRLSGEVIAHRGASSLSPENTRSAVLKALQIGVDWIEIDVRLTRDGAWVVTHDGQIRHHSEGSGKVEELTLGELRRFDFGSWFGPEFRGEKILTLEEASDLILPKASLILDIKTRGKPDELACRMAEVLEKMKSGRIIVSSFSRHLLRCFRRISSRFLLGYLMKDYAFFKTWIARRESFYSIHPHKDVFTPDLARKAQGSGLKVYVWTVNHRDEMEEILASGADGFFTDFPHKAWDLSRHGSIRERAAGSDGS